MKKTYNAIKLFVVLLSLVSLKSGAQAYCIPNTGSIYDDELFNVTFSTLNNTSNCSQTGGPGSVLNVYSNYTGTVPAPILFQGYSYTLSVVGGQCGNYPYGGYVRAWIDYNQNGLFTDPGEQIWTSAYTTFAVAGTTINAGAIVIPSGATPGITRMRVTLMEGSQPSPCTSPSYGEVEDYNVNICPPTPCGGLPSANSIVGPTGSICPNSSANLYLASSYTVVGINYQWQQSTSGVSVGPYVAIPGATNIAYSTPNLTTGTWYQVAITCGNVTGTTNATPSNVMVSSVIVNNVPYYEDFEGITANNQLPNCSWAASNSPGFTRTYINALNQNRIARSGTKFASFYMYLTNGANYFYTNGLQLNAGVTYSANLWYTTESYGYTNVTDLSILYGTTQTPTGLVNIASHSPALSPVYKALGNTFTVPTSGIYYIAIRATGNGSYGAYHLSWDDISVTVPCSLNSSTVTLSASSQTICNGESVNITAAGADTYMWNTGATGAILTDMPNFNTIYSVVGTNTLSGCATTVQSQMVYVNATPNIGVYATNPVICSGELTNLVASGASSYTWSTSSNNVMIGVSPTISTSYVVLGSNANNCASSATVDVQVNPLPLVSVASSGPSSNEICKGESVTLNGNGALNYSWASNSIYIESAQAVVSPVVNTTYTLTGTNVNGCAGKTTIVLNVNECLGINQITTTLSGVKVYPNPTSGLVTIELNTTSPKTVQITDLTGRVVMTSTSNNEKVNVNINNLANGIYYVKIQSDNAVEVIKIVKQ